MAVLAALASLLALGIATGAADGRGAQASAGARARVSISGFRYHPPTIVVRRGAKVTFSNADGVAHTATRRGAFDTGRIRPGHAVTVRFPRRGTFGYFCRIHPSMHGKIVVR